MAALTLVLNAQASEIGHYAPGLLNIRDFVLPKLGIYGAIYNYFYGF